MGRFVEYAATSIESEDPSIFQLLAERSSGRASPDLAVVGFLHHRFADYVSGMGGWIEAEWTRSAERYEELSLGASTEQSLFMLARAIDTKGRRRPTVGRRAERIYGEAVDRGVFAAPRDDVVGIAPNLYPLHPASVAAVALAIRRFGQNERSLFGFLQSLEPASLMRFAHATDYHADNWYRMPWVFDHVAATMSDVPGGDRGRRWSLAFDAVAGTANLSTEHQDVLKVVALLGVLEPLPGLRADADAVAWCLDDHPSRVQPRLDDLAGLRLVYRRPHRGDYGLWSSASVDLLHWLEDARSMVRAPERLDSIQVSSRPCVAHRHYHATGTLRTFEIRLWTGAEPGPRTADGLILVAPVYPGDQPSAILREASTAVADDALAVVCARRVVPQDLKWAHELALWSWIRGNCEELRVDELARTEVDERIATAEAALTHATALLGSASTGRDDSWCVAGEPVTLPPGGVSALLSDLCDRAYDRAPILKNELINRLKLSSAAASARMRLLKRMLGHPAEPDLGMDGAPPERTIYLSVLSQSGMHREAAPGRFAFAPPAASAPGNWRPAWDRVAELLEAGETVTFARLLEQLAAPPYGLRPHPALLLVAAFLLARLEQSDRPDGAQQFSARPDPRALHALGQVAPQLRPAVPARRPRAARHRRSSRERSPRARRLRPDRSGGLRATLHLVQRPASVRAPRPPPCPMSPTGYVKYCAEPPSPPHCFSPISPPPAAPPGRTVASTFRDTSPPSTARCTSSTTRCHPCRRTPSAAPCTLSAPRT